MTSSKAGRLTKVSNHRNGNVSIVLTGAEAAELWALVREGRRAHAKQYAAYDSGFALDLMRKLPALNGEALNEHIRRFGNDQ